MLEPLVLDAEQRRDVDRIARETSGGSLDASTPGAGKTVVALAAAMKRGARFIIVAAPLGTRLGWQNTAHQLGIELPFHWVNNKATKASQDSMNRMQFGEPGIYFIGPEYATTLAWDQVRDKNGEPLRNDRGQLIKKRNHFWDHMRPDMLIIDEVHEGTSNARSQRYKVYSAMKHRHIHALSGTPHGNKFEGIYPVTKVIWPNHTPMTRGEFLQKYVTMEYDPWPVFSGVGEFTQFKRKWCREGTCEDETHLHGTPGGEKVEGAYFASLPCVVRRIWEYDGVVDEENIYVELSAPQRKAYDELEEHMATMIEGDPFVIDFPPTLRIRLRQATLGMFRVEDDGSVGFAPDCKSTKIDALRKALRDDFRGEPTLIFTDSKRFAYIIKARLHSTEHGVAELYSGDQSDKERLAIRDRFTRGMTKYLVVVIKAGGTGLDGFQHATRNMCFVSVDDSRIKNEQAWARVVRRGQGDLVRIRHIIAVDTYDSGILSKHTEAALAMNRSMRLDKSPAIR